MRSVRMRREIEEQQEAALILDVAQPPIRGSPCSLARPASLGGVAGTLTQDSGTLLLLCSLLPLWSHKRLCIRNSLVRIKRSLAFRMGSCPGGCAARCRGGSIVDLCLTNVGSILQIL